MFANPGLDRLVELGDLLVEGHHLLGHPLTDRAGAAWRHHGQVVLGQLVGCLLDSTDLTHVIDYSDKILRDIQQKDRPAGLADVQDDYEVWVKSWGEIFGAGERKLRFFQDQLNYEATDDRITQHLRESYSHFIPDALAQPQDECGETEPTAAPEQEQ
ncbi:hypothetical protein [Streptomyces umbrinus]|uniref:hypothetical protein n=1 Tax=Streptomyces umbrinus TaxID=67370 RepID=UPI0033E4DA0F